MPISNFLSQRMSEFLFLTNRLNSSYGDFENLTEEDKRIHTFKVLCEWPSSREQLRLENMYNPELGLNLELKFITNQQFHALDVYEKIGTESGDCLEKIMEWDGTLDVFSAEISTHYPNFESNNLDIIENELRRTAQSHFLANKHRYLMTLLEQNFTSDILGIRDVQSHSPTQSVTSRKFSAMTLNDFLNIHSLPKNLKEVEEQSCGRNFHFLHSLNPDNLKTEIKDSLNCANSFWNILDIKTQLEKFIDNWAYDRKFNSRYHFGFVDCLLELMWIRERMLAAKNMNATKQNIFWKDINLKNESHLMWLFNWCKDRPRIFLNIVRGSIQQLTENNESEYVCFTLKDFMELEFRSWLCICEHEFLK